MDYPKMPSESKSALDRAGRILAKGTDYIGEAENARLIVAKWRAAHMMPLRVAADDLKERLARLSINAFVALRLKRLFRIRDKLQQSPGMRVTQMQDVGALRAVVPSIADVDRLAADYSERPASCLFESSRDDYIRAPKPSGYRSLHITFKYRATTPSPYDGINLELQVRTQKQHLWASAVEITGLESGAHHKYDKGDPRWTDFFIASAELIARHEGGPHSSEYLGLHDNVISEHVRHFDLEVQAIENYLNSPKRVPQLELNATTQYATGNDSVLLRLDLRTGSLVATLYSDRQQAEAVAAYAAAEAQQSFVNDQMSVVLVSVATPELLREAYPTFFLDASGFAKLMLELIE